MSIMNRGWMVKGFGEVVRQRRNELGLTQEELGERLGRDSQRVSKVEVGHTFKRLPDADEFLHWARALETPPQVILEEMGYIPTQPNRLREQQPEIIFTQLADEVRNSPNMGENVKEPMLDGIKHARRLWEATRDDEP